MARKRSDEHQFSQHSGRSQYQSCFCPVPGGCTVYYTKRERVRGCVCAAITAGLSDPPTAVRKEWIEPNAGQAYHGIYDEEMSAAGLWVISPCSLHSASLQRSWRRKGS